MKHCYSIVLALTCCLAAIPSHAQTAPAQNPPADATQKPATPAKPADANPFPEDTSKVPVMPSRDTSAMPDTSDDGSSSVRVPLPSEDLDPIRSPDDAAPDSGSASSSDSSDSQSGMDKLIPDPDDAPRKGKHGKSDVEEPEHHETPAEDIEVGKYYLESKNWKAALSRFESALVMEPDEPEVYWGLAESERHLGDFAAARGYYKKVAEYDPDSKHGKEAIKALKEPEIANAKAVAQAPPGK